MKLQMEANLKLNKLSFDSYSFLVFFLLVKFFLLINILKLIKYLNSIQKIYI